jgi:hypothetical protein
MNLTQAEQETIFSICAEDRSIVHVFSDDPVFQKKLESIGAKLVREASGGVSKFYEMRSDQLVIRTGKRKVSEEQRARAAINLARSRKTPEAIEDEKE